MQSVVSFDYPPSCLLVPFCGSGFSSSSSLQAIWGTSWRRDSELPFAGFQLLRLVFSPEWQAGSVPEVDCLSCANANSDDNRSAGITAEIVSLFFSTIALSCSSTADARMERDTAAVWSGWPLLMHGLPCGRTHSTSLSRLFMSYSDSTGLRFHRTTFGDVTDAFPECCHNRQGGCPFLNRSCGGSAQLSKNAR